MQVKPVEHKPVKLQPVRLLPVKLLIVRLTQKSPRAMNMRTAGTPKASEKHESSPRHSTRLGKMHRYKDDQKDQKDQKNQKDQKDQKDQNVAR